ncbi:MULTISPECIES: VRR-NUC domain-containing protein [unclassified Oceanobacillus]|uniref:VRR-NUC domain-containing protein n=1 Tax=unclassified Oceanobacillus TaxID=2630292 RepID=UPI00300E6DC3
MSEKRIENAIQRYLDSLGAYHIKNHGSIYSRAGTPDITACVNGKFVAIEVKQPGGVVSPLQAAHIELIRKSGGAAFVAYSLEEAKENLKEFRVI